MMQDDIQSVLISEQQLADAVKKLGEQISRDYADRNLMMVSVLKGSVVFMADLMRAISVPASIDFMSVTSYGTVSYTHLDVYKRQPCTDIYGRRCGVSAPFASGVEEIRRQREFILSYFIYNFMVMVYNGVQIHSSACLIQEGCYAKA